MTRLKKKQQIGCYPLLGWIGKVPPTKVSVASAEVTSEGILLSPGIDLFFKNFQGLRYLRCLNF